MNWYPHRAKHFVRFDNDLAYGLGCRLANRTQKVIRLTNLQIVKKYLVQFVIVILTRMNQNVLGVFVQLGNDPTHFDQFGARANNGHDFKHEVLP
jgi:hypothetical protein